jgi:hypothetical protein
MIPDTNKPEVMGVFVMMVRVAKWGFCKKWDLSSREHILLLLP